MSRTIPTLIIRAASRSPTRSFRGRIRRCIFVPFRKEADEPPTFPPSRISVCRRMFADDGEAIATIKLIATNLNPQTECHRAGERQGTAARLALDARLRVMAPRLRYCWPLARIPTATIPLACTPIQHPASSRIERRHRNRARTLGGSAWTDLRDTFGTPRL